MDGSPCTRPIVVVDEALAHQLLEDGERVVDGLAKILDAVRVLAPPRPIGFLSSARAASGSVTDGE